VVDGVFEALPDAESVTFHPAQIDEAAISQVQANVRKRILRAFVARGHMEACDAKDINERAASSSHGGGFSVDAGVRIEAPDRAGLERLLRWLMLALPEVPTCPQARICKSKQLVLLAGGLGYRQPMASAKARKRSFFIPTRSF